MSFNKPPRAGIILGYSHEAAMVTDTVRVPLVRNEITVARPFIYSYRDEYGKAQERRYDPGTVGIPTFMMRDPWIVVDFADGRISHINGRPVHLPTDGKPVTDHRPAARKAMEQRTRIGGNQAPTAGPKPVPKPVEGSLNLVGEINVVEHGHPVF